MNKLLLLFGKPFRIYQVDTLFLTTQFGKICKINSSM